MLATPSQNDFCDAILLLDGVVDCHYMVNIYKFCPMDHMDHFLECFKTTFFTPPNSAIDSEPPYIRLSYSSC